MKKIETNSLKLGNIIDFNGSLFKVTEIYANAIKGINIFDDNHSGTIPGDEIKGIKFSEKLLNGFGWYNDEGNNFKLVNTIAPISHIENHLDIEFPYDDNTIRVFISFEKDHGAAVYLNYLHELQNLFQALHFKEIHNSAKSPDFEENN